MNPEEKTLALLIAQSKLIAHLGERLVILQVSFEAFVRARIGETNGNLDEHYKLRRQMLEEDFSGTTTDLLNTLKQAIVEADKP